MTNVNECLFTNDRDPKQSVSIFRYLTGHRPVNVKRAVIGSKGGWKLSTIFLSCKVFHDWSIIKLGNILYLLDRSIFAVLFGTISHCFC